MTVLLWFLGGLILAAAFSAGVVYWYKERSKREQPLPPETLPKDWASVMPREKAKSTKKEAKSDPYSFRKVGVKVGSNGRSASKLK